MRVSGSASLKMTLFSLDETVSDVLLPIPLQSTTDVEPNRLANLTTQRAKLRIQISNIDETFKISKLILFVRPVAKSWPEMT